MDWMQFVSALVSALAWPCSVVVVVCLLKNPILGLIPKIRSFKYGELHVDLTEALQSLKEELPATPTEPDAQPEAPRIQLSVPLQIAAVSPRGAMLAAWLEVEAALNDLMNRKGLVVDPMQSPRKRLEQLLSTGGITMSMYNTFSKTLSLRNEAVHRLDREINYVDAVDMAVICQRLVESLQNA